MDYVLCCTLSALINQSTANICRPYSSSNKEYIVTIRKRKISYFILNISMTLLVYRSIALRAGYTMCKSPNLNRLQSNVFIDLGCHNFSHTVFDLISGLSAYVIFGKKNR